MTDSSYRVIDADYAADEAAIRKVRFTVFVDEQAVPAELEMDDRDPECIHVLALDEQGEPIGTGRIDIDDGGRLGRMAVLASYRRLGVGRALMDALHAHADARGCKEVWCHAQIAAQAFYERAGYVADGERFIEAGIEHVTMRRPVRR